MSRAEPLAIALQRPSEFLNLVLNHADILMHERSQRQPLAQKRIRIVDNAIVVVETPLEIALPRPQALTHQDNQLNRCDHSEGQHSLHRVATREAVETADDQITNLA